MTILEDKNGSYDLTSVVAITPVIERDRVDQTKILSNTALLHFVGGNGLHTATAFDAAISAWKGLKTPAPAAAAT